MQDIFCNIVERKEPATIVYEDGLCLAFLDNEPIAEGHSLVIPKKHYESVFDIPDDELQAVILAIKAVAKIVKEQYNYKGISIRQNNGIFQEIPHVHFHVYGKNGPL